MHPINMISLQVLIPNVLTMELSLHKKKKNLQNYPCIHICYEDFYFLLLG